MMLQALGRAALVAACAGSAADTAGGVARTGGTTAGVPLPSSALAVLVGTAWREWWRSERAPTRYDSRAAPGGAPGGALASAVRWQNGADGVEWADEALAGGGEAWRTRLVLVRLDTRRVRLALDTAFDGGIASWNIARADRRAGAPAIVALNAGQFARTLPWGWVVLDGARFLAPAVAPLVTTLTVARDGAVRFTHATVPDSAGVRWAFQSYPTLLNGSVVPGPLRNAGCGVDVAHRDARLALGVDASGRLLVAMTRFDGLGGALDRVPFGLTTPEMAAVMGSLGATDAVLLDGGISAQLLVRDAGGVAHRWPGVRNVPLGLVVYAR